MLLQLLFIRGGKRGSAAPTGGDLGNKDLGNQDAALFNKCMRICLREDGGRREQGGRQRCVPGGPGVGVPGGPGLDASPRREPRWAAPRRERAFRRGRGCSTADAWRRGRWRWGVEDVLGLCGYGGGGGGKIKDGSRRNKSRIMWGEKAGRRGVTKKIEKRVDIAFLSAAGHSDEEGHHHAGHSDEPCHTIQAEFPGRFSRWLSTAQARAARVQHLLSIRGNVAVGTRRGAGTRRD